MRGEDLLEAFITHIKGMKHVTVDRVPHHMTDELLKAHIVGVDVHFGVLVENHRQKIPVSRYTVHRWMVRGGCTYDEARQTYYPDSRWV